jgi:hypothetical protein
MAYAAVMATPDIVHLECLEDLFRKIDAVSRCAKEPRDHVERQISILRRRERRNGNGLAVSPVRRSASSVSTSAPRSARKRKAQK